MILAATGHRPEKLGGYEEDAYERLYDFALSWLSYLAPERVISGMALGWDTAIAEAAIVLDIPLHAYLLFPSQPSRWGRKAQTLHANLLAAAEHVESCSPDPFAGWKMMHRNKRMVDDCTVLFALYNGDPTGGTANCVEYAARVGKETHNVWKDWLDVQPNT